METAPFKIEPETGRIRFPDLPLDLWPQIPEKEFLAATSSLNRDNLGANDGWQRYSIRAPISEDRKLGLCFVFLNGLLNRISFTYGHKNETWENWTEEREQNIANGYIQLLTSQLGPGNTFSWGKVGVEYDQKSGETDIAIWYSNVH